MQDISTENITLSVSDGTAMPAYVARPAKPERNAGLLVFQEAFGVNAHMRHVAERFAQAGYVAIAPALYHRTDGAFEGSYTDFAAVGPHMQALTDAGQSADVRAAFDWLTDRSGGNVKAVGSTGYCMGGRTSFLANLTLPIQASVSYYGSGIAPSPTARFPALIERAAELHAPALFFWGGLDKHILPVQTRAVEDGMRAAGKKFTQVIISDADHGFSCDDRASFNPNATRQAWALTLEFLATYVQPAG